MCGNSCCMMPSTGHSGHHHLRRFYTKEEKIKQLEEYSQELKMEIKAVEELISEIKG